MPKFVYECEAGHETEQLVPTYDGYEVVLCEFPDVNGTAKVLDDNGEVIVCGRDAVRSIKSCNPARRNPAHGIQR